MVVGILAFVLVFAQVGFIRRGERTANMTDSIVIDYRGRAVNDEHALFESMGRLDYQDYTAVRAHWIRFLSFFVNRSLRQRI